MKKISSVKEKEKKKRGSNIHSAEEGSESQGRRGREVSGMTLRCCVISCVSFPPYRAVERACTAPITKDTCDPPHQHHIKQVTAVHSYSGVVGHASNRTVLALRVQVPTDDAFNDNTVHEIRSRAHTHTAQKRKKNHKNKKS